MNNDFLEEMFSAAPVVNTDVDNQEFDEFDEEDIAPVVEDVPKSDPLPVEDGDEVIENYVKFLQENQLVDIPEGYDFKGQAEQLQEVFEYTKRNRRVKATEDLFEQLPDNFKPLLDYALRGGTSIEEYLSVFNDNIENTDLSTPESQKQMLFRYYKETSPYADDKIHRLIARFNDDDELKLEAEDAYNHLAQNREQRKVRLLEQTTAQQKAIQQEIEEKTVALNKAIEETANIHGSRKNKVRAFFFEPVQAGSTITTGFNATINSILANPEHQAQLADILLDYSADAGFTSDRLEKRVKSKAMVDFREAVKSKLDPKRIQKNNPTTKNTSFDWEEYQNSINKHA